jgi:hypothetical protein
MKINIHIWLYLSNFVLEWEIFQTKSCGQNQITQFTFNNVFSEIRAVYETMWNTIVDSDRPQTKIRRMLIAFLITEAEDTHSEEVLLQKLLHESAWMLLYTYIACTFFFLRYRSLISICSTPKRTILRCHLKREKKCSDVLNSQSKGFVFVHFAFCIIPEISHPYSNSMLSTNHIAYFNVRNMQDDRRPPFLSPEMPASWQCE